MRFAATLTVALVLVLLGAATGKADVSIECSVDAWGMSGYYNENWNADVNYGTQTDPYGTVMMAGWTDGASVGNKKFWVKFDLSSISDMATNATLRLTRAADPDGWDVMLVFALNDGDAGEDWGEYTITYNNAPGNVIASNTLDAARYTFLGAPAYEGGRGTVISLSSEALLQAVNNDTNNRLTLAFLKRMYYHEGCSLYSREDSTYAGATLDLAVPEPCTIMLLIGGAGLLAVRRRRK